MSDGISTKEVVKELFFVIKLLLQKIYWLIILGIVGGASFFFGGKYLVKGYDSDVSFTMASNSGGAFSAYMALASQFGMMSGENTTEDKLVVLLKSRRVIISSLLKKIPGSDQKLVNYYIESNELDQKWGESNIKLNNFKFTSTSYDSITYLEDSLLENMVDEFLDASISLEIDKESNIIYLNIYDLDEVFAFEFSRSLVNSVIDYYTSQSSRKEKETFDILRSSLDSVVNELKHNEEVLAKHQDQRKNSVRMIGNIEELRLMREVKILSLMYAEGLKNLEIAKISFLEKKAIIDIIDRPILPLTKRKVSGILLIIIGGFVFCSIFSLIVLMRHYFNFKELWNDENLHRY